MKKSSTGGPAFPSAPDGSGEKLSDCKGMTLRDYFAAKALPAVYQVALDDARSGSRLFDIADWEVGLAKDAYRIADAMLAARET